MYNFILFLGGIFFSFSIGATNPDSLIKSYQLYSKKEDLVSIGKFYLYEKINRDSLRKYGTLLIQNDQEFNSLTALWGRFFQITAEKNNADSLIQSDLRKIIKNAESQSAFDLCAEANILLSSGLGTIGEFETSIQEGKKALAFLEKAEGFDSLNYFFNEGWIHSLISYAYRKSGDYSSALEYAIRSEKSAEKSQSIKRKYSAASLFVAIYGNLSSDEKLLVSESERKAYRKKTEEYLKKTYDLSKEEGAPKRLAVSSYNIGVFLSLDSQLVSAMAYIDSALIYGEIADFKPLLIDAYDVKSDIFNEWKMVDSSLFYQKKSYAIASDYNSLQYKATSSIGLANAYLRIGDPDNAFPYLTEGEAIAEQIGYTPKLKTAYFGFYEYYRLKGDYKNALENYLNYEMLKDSIVSEESAEKINELSAKYESEQKEREILTLKNDQLSSQLLIRNKNNLIIVSILSSLLLIGIFYYFFHIRNKMERQKALNAKQKLLRSQLNPHFLFNALNSIQQYIYQKEDPTLVADYLARFSRLTRKILINSKEDLISLEEEIGFLKDYLELQTIRFDEPFLYDLQIDENIELDEVYIPPMFTQPFIENSIEHGILNKKEKGEILIQFSKLGDELEVKIEDNGVGIERSIFLKRNKKHRSMATSITYERLKILEKKLRKKVSLNILDRSGDGTKITGTRVILTLPILYK